MARRALTTSAAIKKSSSSGLNKTGSKVSFDESGPKTFVVESPSAAKNASWYSPDELSSFRKGESSATSRAVRKEFVRSLLNIQNEHKALGIQDPKGLRQMSRAISKESIKSAIQRAHEVVTEEDSSCQFELARKWVYRYLKDILGERYSQVFECRDKLNTRCCRLYI